jgi:hypothetical protein
LQRVVDLVDVVELNCTTKLINKNKCENARHIVFAVNGLPS